MSEKASVASQRNGRKSRGAVTPEGKGHAARANLRHGFYAQELPEVMIGLGEDPHEYRRLQESLENNFVETLEGQIVGRIGRTLWRMQRAERMQDGLAVKRVQSGLQMEELAAAPRYTHNYDIYQRLEALGAALEQPDFTLSAAEFQAFVTSFGVDPADDVKSLFPLLRSFGKEGSRAAGPATECGGSEPVPSTEGQGSARRELQATLQEVMTTYGKACERFIGRFEKIRSPENIAALMAPRDDHAMLMQRMEDSNLRQLWRLTNMLAKVRNGKLA
jgi:hypothetical protein